MPTNRLRWIVDVEYLETGYDTFTKHKRTLQQWWESVLINDDLGFDGEWRDVPVEDEK